MANVTIPVNDPNLIKALTAMADANRDNIPPGPSSEAVSDSTAGQTIVIDKPADVISSSSAEFYRLHTLYVTLRELARPLNGLSQASVLPDNVKVTKVTLNFAVNDVEYSADIDSVKNIGEVAPLLASALNISLDRMNQELFTLNQVVSGMQRAINQAVSVMANKAQPEPETKENETPV